jgi:hypothetical protein
MKILSMLVLMLFFASTNMMANNNSNETLLIEFGPSDGQVKKLVQYMIKAYNLNPDQQMKVKEAALKMATDATALRPIETAERTKLRDAFSSTMSTTLSAAQYAQYKSALSTEINKILDEIIDAAAK